MALTTLEKLIRLRSRISSAKSSIRGNKLVLAYKYMESAERKVSDLIQDLVEHKKYFNKE